MSDGVDSDPNVTRWSFDANATTRWSIESGRFGTIEMSCRALQRPDGAPDGLPRTVVLSMFTIDGIYYMLIGGAVDSMPATCDSASQLDSSFLAVLDQLQVTDLKSWMTWAGVTDISEPLPDPPSTDLPN